MPYILVDDGYPGAGEYTSSYVWYDTDDPESLRQAVKDAQRLLEDRRKSREQPSADR